MGLDGAILMAKATQNEIDNYEDGRDPPKQDMTLDGTGKPNPTYKGFNERWKETMEKITGDDRKGNRTSRIRAFHDTLKHDVPGQPKQSIKKNREEGKEDFETRKWSEVAGQTTQTISEINTGGYNKYTGESLYNPLGKNPGDIFLINPKPFPEAHFATFPVELPERIIKCACPPDGIVFDPFFGAGTVGLAAEKLGRKWAGIEINEKYIDMARKRLDKYKNEGIDVYF
jgi:DNA modification methylase